MAIFWEWGIRNPFALGGTVVAVAGFTGVLPWGLALAALAICCLFVRVGNTFLAQARLREWEAVRRARARAALGSRIFVDESNQEPGAKAA